MAFLHCSAFWSVPLVLFHTSLKQDDSVEEKQKLNAAFEDFLSCNCGLTTPQGIKYVPRKGNGSSFPSCDWVNPVHRLPEGWYTLSHGQVCSSKPTLKQCLSSVKNINVSYTGNATALEISVSPTSCN